MSVETFCAQAEKLLQECKNAGLLQTMLTAAADEEDQWRELRKAGRLEFGKRLAAYAQKRKDKTGHGEEAPAKGVTTAEDESYFQKICSKFLTVSKVELLFEGLGMASLLEAKRFNKHSEKRKRHALEVLMAELHTASDSGEHRWLARDLLSTMLALVVMDLRSGLELDGGDGDRGGPALPPKAPRTFVRQPAAAVQRAETADAGTTVVPNQGVKRPWDTKTGEPANGPPVGMKAAQTAVAWMAHKAVKNSKELTAAAVSTPPPEEPPKASRISLQSAMRMMNQWMTGKGRKPKLPPAIGMDVPAHSVAWKAVKMTNTGKFYVFKIVRPCGEVVRYAVSVSAACNHYEDAARIARICFSRLERGSTVSETDELRQSLYRLCYLRRVADGSMQAAVESRGRVRGRARGRGRGRGEEALPLVVDITYPQVKIDDEPCKLAPEPECPAEPAPPEGMPFEPSPLEGRRLEILANIIGELPLGIAADEPAAAVAAGYVAVSKTAEAAAAATNTIRHVAASVAALPGQGLLQFDTERIVEQFRRICDGQEAATMLSEGSVDTIQKLLEAKIGFPAGALEHHRSLIDELRASENARRKEAVQDSVARLVSMVVPSAEEQPAAKFVRLVKKSRDPVMPVLPPLLKPGPGSKVGLR